MKKKTYRFFSIHTLTGTLFVIAVSFLISQVAHTIDFFNPMERAFKDFTLTDIVFQPNTDEHGQITRFNDKRVSDKIVLVNLGGAGVGREGLSAMLDRINAESPAVVGIDAFFRKPGDPYADSLLAESFRKTRKLVLVSKIDSLDQNDKFRHITRSYPLFSTRAHSGFANFITGGDDGYLTTRRFSARETIGRQTEWCFAGKILSLYDAQKFEVLKSRKKQTELINYSGNLDQFYRLDYTTVFDPAADLSILKDKIVLIGFLGEPMGQPSLEDVFFTPMNQEMAGRSVPDMYGITVHANILSMMLGEYYIAQAPNWLDPLLAVFICMLNVSIFLFIGHKYRRSSQLLMRITQLVQGTVLTGLLIYLLAVNDVYVEFTVSLTLLFLCADLTEIYEGSVHGFIERFEHRNLSNRRSSFNRKER
ncbi:MAG: CHASE2 domain-containing protein [Bacteroidota bacterium]